MIAVYPGTFDPFHKGHMDIVRRSLPMFDKIVVGVSNHSRKNVKFTIEERCQAIRDCFADEPKVHVVEFNDLLTDLATRNNAHAIIRGLRVTSDFEYEFKMAQFIDDQNCDAEVVYLMASRKTLHISSTSVKELANLKADISNYVPKSVLDMVKQAYEY